MTEPVPDRSASEKRAERERLAVVAYALLDLGLSIFPAHHPWTPIPSWCEKPEMWSVGKSAMRRWKPYQTERPSEEQVRSWWGGSELFNIGVATGPASGFDVVDVDNAAAKAWADDNLDPTPMVTFSGRDVAEGERGEHRYYRRPPGLEGWLRRSWPAGFELKTLRHCITAPGSRHPSGRLYEAAAPWTPALLAEVPTFQGAALYYLPPPAPPRAEGQVGPPSPEHEVEARAQKYVDTIPGVAHGGRHHAAVRVALALGNDFALGEASALEILADWNSRNDPPLPEMELRQILRTVPQSASKPPGCKRDAPAPLRFPTAACAPDAPPHGDEDFSGGETVDLGGPVAKVVTHPSAKPNRLDCIVWGTDVEEKQKEFLLYPIFPQGELVLLTGEGGTGKSIAAAKMGAAITVRGQICGDRPNDYGPVLVFSAEDQPEYTLKKRFRLSGADLSAVAFRSHELDPEGVLKLDRSGMRLIEAALDKVKPRFVIIDPIARHVDGKFDMNSSSAVYNVLEPLQELAKASLATFLVLAHHNGSNDIMGSKAFRDAARSVMSVYRHPVDQAMRVICHRKASIGVEGKSLTYRIDQAVEGDPYSAVAVWTGKSDHTAAEMMAASQMPAVDRIMAGRAAALLMAELQGGAKQLHYIFGVANALGIEKRHVSAASLSLRCRVENISNQDGSPCGYISLAAEEGS